MTFFSEYKLEVREIILLTRDLLLMGLNLCSSFTTHIFELAQHFGVSYTILKFSDSNLLGWDSLDRLEYIYWLCKLH